MWCQKNHICLFPQWSLVICDFQRLVPLHLHHWIRGTDLLIESGYRPFKVISVSVHIPLFILQLHSLYLLFFFIGSLCSILSIFLNFSKNELVILSILFSVVLAASDCCWALQFGPPLGTPRRKTIYEMHSGRGLLFMFWFLFPIYLTLLSFQRP